MAVDLAPMSRLALSDLRTIDGIEFWDTLVLPEPRTRRDDIVYTAKSGDRIDLLAHRFYQDPVLWWVIAWANDIEIIPTDLKEGQELLIPSMEFINTNLLSSRRRRG